MERSQKYYLSLFILMVYANLLSQVNCNTIEGEDCKKSCEISNEAGHFQGFYDSQKLFDQAIALCPENDAAYAEKAVPFLKRGEFISWKKLIDKAVELNPKMHLGYRGWCKYQFLRDYEGALKDFDDLEKFYPNNIGRSVNGDYDLYIAKAFCLDALGKTDKAISTIEKAINRTNYFTGNYDYFQLGVLYFQQNKFDKALENFEKQSKVLDFAENIFYKAKVSKIRNKDYLELKNLALKTYDEGKFMKDPYTHHYNKVYRKQIAEL